MGVTIEKVDAAKPESTDVVAMIKALAEGEKFKQDAFFFCGFPSEAPNEELMYACNNYVEAVQNGTKDGTVVSRLIAELEKASGKDSGLKESVNHTSSKPEIAAILALKDRL